VGQREADWAGKVERGVGKAEAPRAKEEDKSEGRRPKSERSPKAEGRMLLSGVVSPTGVLGLLRASGFGLLSVLGLRASDFNTVGIKRALISRPF
jgi:hypothetical protein